MIGKNQIQLGATEFISGMASTDYSMDGALGTSSSAINTFSTPGIIRSTEAGTDMSTNVSGNMIASCEDSNAASPYNRYFVDDAGNYYYTNGASITKVKTSSDTTGFVTGKTDFISWAGNFYASRTAYLTKWDGSGTLNETFKTFSDASAHHPMLVFESSLWVADGNTLSTLASDGTTYTTSVLTLSPKEKIVALGIDPGTGLMLISAQTIYDVSDSIPSLKAVYLYDGFSGKPRRKILVDDMVTAFYNLEGQVYVGAGQTIGLWNGSGVTFLRKLANVSLSNTDLPYKHHFANVRNILLIVDGKNILAYGAAISGRKSFFNIAVNAINTNKLSLVTPIGSNKIVIAHATNKLYSYDLSSTAVGNGVLYFNNIFFPRPVFIRRIRVLTTGLTTTSGYGGVAFFDETGFVHQTDTYYFAVPASASPKYTFDFDYNAKCLAIQPRITFPQDQSVGIIRIIIYYDVAE